MRKVCFYHAGCPDGFGAAWALWQAWGSDGEYRPRGHDDRCKAGELQGALVAFVDIAPSPEEALEIADHALQLIILDHHVSNRDRYALEPELETRLQREGHLVHFDLNHSGAVLAWQHFHPNTPPPELLQYVEDQDIWAWKLHRSEQVNAALSAYPREFRLWDKLANSGVQKLMEEGEPIVRVRKREVSIALQNSHIIQVNGEQVEAVNSPFHRSQVGHALAERARFGEPWGAVYRIAGKRVDVSLYSIGDFDVAIRASSFGGGGHQNAAGFSIDLDSWRNEFLSTT